MRAVRWLLGASVATKLGESDENLVKVKMRMMDYKHIKEILEYRVNFLYDDFALEILEQLKKHNKYLI